MDNKYDRIIPVIGETPKDFGKYCIKGNDVIYIGHTEDGWWYWLFNLYDEDVNKSDSWFGTLMDEDDYYNNGYSCGYFNTLKELKAIMEIMP